MRIGTLSIIHLGVLAVAAIAERQPLSSFVVDPQSVLRATTSSSVGLFTAQRFPLSGLLECHREDSKPASCEAELRADLRRLKVGLATLRILRLAIPLEPSVPVRLVTFLETQSATTKYETDLQCRPSDDALSCEIRPFTLGLPPRAPLLSGFFQNELQLSGQIIFRLRPTQDTRSSTGATFQGYWPPN